MPDPTAHRPRQDRRVQRTELDPDSPIIDLELQLARERQIFRRALCRHPLLRLARDLRILEHRHARQIGDHVRQLHLQDVDQPVRRPLLDQPVLVVGDPDDLDEPRLAVLGDDVDQLGIVGEADRGDLRIVIERDRPVEAHLVARSEPVAGAEHVAAEVLQEVERPARRLLVGDRAREAERQLEAKATLLGIVALLGEQVGEAVGHEVPVRHRLGARIRRDPVDRIVAAEPVGHHHAPVQRSGIAVDRLQCRIDRIPARRMLLVRALVVAGGLVARSGRPLEHAGEPIVAHDAADEHRLERRRKLLRHPREGRGALVVGELTELVDRGDLRRTASLIEALQQRSLRNAVIEPLPRQLRPLRLRRTRELGHDVLLADGLLTGAGIRLELALIGAARIEIQRTERGEPGANILDRPELVASGRQLVDQLRSIANQACLVASADREVMLELRLVEQVRTPHRVQRRRNELLAGLVARRQLLRRNHLVEVGHEQLRDLRGVGDAVVLEQRRDPARAIEQELGVAALGLEVFPLRILLLDREVPGRRDPSAEPADAEVVRVLGDRAGFAGLHDRGEIDKRVEGIREHPRERVGLVIEVEHLARSVLVPGIDLHVIGVAVPLRADPEHAAERLDQIGAEVRELVAADHQLEQILAADIGPQIVVEP